MNQYQYQFYHQHLDLLFDHTAKKYIFIQNWIKNTKQQYNAYNILTLTEFNTIDNFITTQTIFAN